MRKHSSISLKRFRNIESVFKRGAFALVDAKEALGRAKRDASMSLLPLGRPPHKRSEQQLV
jgi:hypothetical protein